MQSSREILNPLECNLDVFVALSVARGSIRRAGVSVDDMGMTVKGQVVYRRRLLGMSMTFRDKGDMNILYHRL